MADSQDPMAGFEADLYGNESPTVKTKRIFDQSAPFAAAGIVDMALHGSSESVRLKASQYVVDRVLGPVGKDDSEDALDKFLSGIEKLANQGHAES